MNDLNTRFNVFYGEKNIYENFRKFSSSIEPEIWQAKVWKNGPKIG